MVIHAVSHALVFQEDKILVCRRKNGVYELPGGRRPDGEFFTGGLEDSLRLYYGLEAEVGFPFVAVDFDDKGWPSCLCVYVCKIRSGAPHSSDCDEFRYVSLEEARKLPFYHVEHPVIRAIPELFQRRKLRIVARPSKGPDEVLQEIEGTYLDGFAALNAQQYLHPDASLLMLDERGKDCGLFPVQANV